LHWGLHAWAIYAVIGLGLAFVAYNKGLTLSISSFLRAAFPRVPVWLVDAIDVLAITATVCGVAASLGFGASQINAGLELLFGVPETGLVKAIIIVVVTGLATLSVALGLDVGIKRLSEANMALAVGLALFVLIAGPTVYLLDSFIQNLGYYAQRFIYLSTWTESYTSEDWQSSWTLFYYAWWISWSPFVGMFIARVSRGRTVREFLVSVLLIPSLACVLWMTVFGGTAISQVVHDGYMAAVEAALPLQLFSMLDALPLAGITSFIAIILVVVFFVTSSDSGSLVIDTIAAGGKVNAPTPQRVFWCTFEGLVAIALILGGGLVALQAMAVSTGFPFTIVLLASCIAVVKGLMSEPRGN
ncbi:TPA: hypothetical protein DCX24_10430, partial [Candidatus Azambacteria bacterium]|nr:hypothetical protein [Candidatus Azambacteria bacterium]